MMFMIPTPPTRSETPTTPKSSPVTMSENFLKNSRTWSCVWTMKSSASSPRRPCRRRRSQRTWSTASSVRPALAFPMMTTCFEREPPQTLKAVEIGMSTWSS